MIIAAKSYLLRLLPKWNQLSGNSYLENTAEDTNYKIEQKHLLFQKLRNTFIIITDSYLPQNIYATLLSV
jgi:hypothetical protein